MNSKAVSPVIGVMLMLVATVVIAAVVTSYSGGLASEEAKAPQATFDVSFSQKSGLKLVHTGGNVLQCKDVKLRLEYTEAWGTGGYVGQGATIPQENITYAKTTNNTFSEGCSFGPGDVALVPISKIPPAMGGDFTNSSRPMGITNPANVGKPLKVIIVDEISGKPVFKTDVLITP